MRSLALHCLGMSGSLCSRGNYTGANLRPRPGCCARGAVAERDSPQGDPPSGVDGVPEAAAGVAAWPKPLRRLRGPLTHSSQRSWD